MFYCILYYEYKKKKKYLKDSNYSAYEAYESFEKFCRPKSMPISDYIIEFERLHNKIKNHNMILPDGILAYKFLNNAKITGHHKQLVRATLSELKKYDKMKEQIKKVFSDPTNFTGEVKEETNIKVETSFERGTFYGNNNKFYNQKKNHSNWQRQSNFYPNINFYKRYNKPLEETRFTRKTNPLNKDGEISKCLCCGSIYHWTKQCPDSYENKMKKKNDSQITLVGECMITLN